MYHRAFDSLYVCFPRDALGGAMLIQQAARQGSESHVMHIGSKQNMLQHGLLESRQDKPTTFGNHSCIVVHAFCAWRHAALEMSKQAALQDSKPVKKPQGQRSRCPV